MTLKNTKNINKIKKNITKKYKKHLKNKRHKTCFYTFIKKTLKMFFFISMLYCKLFEL